MTAKNACRTFWGFLLVFGSCYNLAPLSDQSCCLPVCTLDPKSMSGNLLTRIFYPRICFLRNLDLQNPQRIWSIIKTKILILELKRYSLVILNVNNCYVDYFSKGNDWSLTLCQGYVGGEITPFGMRPYLEMGNFWISGFGLIEK